MNKVKTPQIEKEVGKAMKNRDDGKIITLKLNQIKPYPKNAKIHTEKQVAKIRDSIISLGYRNKIEVDENNVILAGHGRLRAWYQIDTTGSKKITVIQYKGYTESENKAYRIANNQLNLDTGFDVEILKEEFHELEDTDNFNDTGFEVKEISAMLDNDKEIVEDTVNVDAYERVKNKTKIKPGEVYLLGDHRLMCGDSTEGQQIDKLTKKLTVNLLLADPPYGISIVKKNGKIGDDVLAKNGNYPEVIGDDAYFDPTPLLKIGEKQVIWGANYFCDKLPLGTRWLVWDKERPSGTDFSDCELAWTNKKARSIKKYKCTWHGMIREGESDKRVHPTQKPIKLISDILSDYSNRNDNVLDLFGGSGSTLIACEQLERRCFMMELDPVYCQVIIDRWEKFTNKKAIKA